MEESLKKQIEKAIHQISFPDSMDDKYKSTITTIFKELAEYQEREFNRMKKEIKEQEREKQVVGQVVPVIVVARTEEERSGGEFYPLDRECCIRERVPEVLDQDLEQSKEKTLSPWKYDVFLRCGYEKMQGYLSKPYKGYICYQNGKRQEVQYELVRNERMLEKFKALNEVAEIYCWQNRQIFAPDVYHAVDVIVLNETKETIDWSLFKEFDFDLQHNGLSPNLIQATKKLYWNIEEKKINDLRGGPETDDGVKIYRYFYRDIEEFDFLLPDYKYEDIKKKKLDRGYQIEVSSNKSASQNSACTLFRVDGQILERRKEKQKPDERAVTMPRRMRSEGDISNVLSWLEHVMKPEEHALEIEKEEPKFFCEYDGLECKDKQKIIQRYAMEHRKPFGKRSECYIKFHGPQIYLCDYANFVLKYLEEYYPDFTWVGISS